MERKEAIEIVRKLYNESLFLKKDKEAMITLIPELKESEDERIRKEIIQFLQLPHPQFVGKRNYEEWIAWLEKQGEPIDKIQLGKKYKCIASPRYSTFMKGEIYKPEDKFLCSLMNFCYDCFEPIEDGKQKPADKVKPKFKVGDWAVSDLDKMTRYISEVHNDKYNNYYVIKGDVETERDINEYDRLHHLWTIQDAKDGDVLFQDLMGGKTFIYNGVNPDMAILYSFIISNDGEDVLPYHIGKPNTGIGYIEENKNIIHPATKEQRALLFQKMKEAGYEWNTEKKELKKIEQKPQRMVSAEAKEAMYDKPAWSEEDERIYKSIMYSFAHNYPLSIQQQEFVKSLKYRVLPQPKQQWSEEDTTHYNRILKELNIQKEMPINASVIEEVKSDIIWLKSLKDRSLMQSKQKWSEEDEETLNIAIHIIESTKPNVYTKESEIKDGVIDWLKSLKYRVLPKQEWSEEDEKRVENILSVLNVQECWNGATGKKEQPYQREIDWLKSIRPQNRWKPSKDV